MSTFCKHCGKPIQQTNWYDGPGWTHSDEPRGMYCRPTTIATPPDGHPLHRDHTEDLETGVASVVREIDEMRAENQRLRAALDRVTAVINLPYWGTYWGEVMVPQPKLRAALEEGQP